ncbi:LysM peptidoglycan-binding domain-containing protein [Bacillus tianshenii]|nr:LysM peptidoglycan-binding domain-containing protein [Bacillus tianshenii]
MKVQLTKRQTIVFAISLGIIVLAASLTYFFLIRPIHKELTSIERQIEVNENTLEAMQRNERKENILEDIEVTKLQKKLPTEGRVEELILNFEKAEVVSDSHITTMSFQENEVEQAEQASPQGPLERSGEAAGTPQEEVPMPEGLQKVQISISVESNDYQSLQQFLTTIEEMDRLLLIENLAFSGVPEKVMVPQSEEVLTYQVNLSAYSMPELATLIEKLPSIDTPPPSNKDNPLAVPYEREAEPQIEEEPPKPQAPEPNNQSAQKQPAPKPKPQVQAVKAKVIKHTVQENENLYRISLKYYGSRKGEAIIRRANNLEGNRVEVGQVLKIPLS